MNNNISIQELIKESQCSEPWIFDKWLKTNKPNLEIGYSDISMAFWKLSQTQPVQSPSLAIKEISIILDKSQLGKSLEYIGRKSLGAVQKTVIDPVNAISDINPTVAKAILQGEAGITVSTAKQPIIGSFGAGPCVIISIYNKESNTCALAHVDARANPRTVLCMLSYQLEKDPSGQLIVELATGQIEDNQTLQDLKSIISENKNMSLEKLHLSSSLVIYARTGKTFINVDAYSMDLGLNHKNRMEQELPQLCSHSVESFLFP